MIVTVAFDVKNYVEVMEDWPIKIGNTTFSLDREDNVVRKVSLSYSNVSIEFSPKITSSTESKSLPSISISDGGYATLAIKQIMNWQAVVSGLQIFDLDFDNYVLRFHPETIEEEKQIQIKSFSRGAKKALNSTCDFEKIGRAFCVNSIENSRIESTSHYREARIAFEAGRYVDSYNNMFLFLESRYCDGKTRTNQQMKLLSNNAIFCESLERTILEMRNRDDNKSKHLADVFDENITIVDKIKSIILLRGKLRHHSLKSPQRWDPNKQDEYEMPSRFLGAVVGDIVIAESISDIYSAEALKQFRDISVETGFETKVIVDCYRLEKKPYLSLDMSYPTTVISSQICLTAFRNAIKACEENDQISDTVNLEATQSKVDLELFSIELGTWAFTETRIIKFEETQINLRCRFEHYVSGIIKKDEFSLPIESDSINIKYAWDLLKWCLDRIESIDPTTRILGLKLFLNDTRKPLLSYRVGPQVKS